MESIDTELVGLLKFLLPGFFAAWIFHALSSYPKQAQFERVVQALIFTILIQGMMYLSKAVVFFIGKYVSFGVWIEGGDLVLSLLSAIVLGFLITYFSNNDKFHKVLRNLNITRETSYASEWFGAFSGNVTYVVLHLIDGRRIYGWPIEWPTEQKNGHFSLTSASWLNDDNSQTELNGVKSILIRGSDVHMVEFMSPIMEEEVANEQESFKSTTAATEAAVS